MESIARLVSVDDAALRRLLDNIPVGIGIAEPVEPDGSIKPEARIVYYNKHWVKMFGFDVDDVRTVKEATWRLYPDPELLDERLRSRKEAADRRRAGGGEQTEARAMGADGKWLTVITGTTVVGNRLVVTMLDITAQKEAERALAAALENEQAARTAAERATRAKSLFLANVSHEIRTPLSVLVSLAQAMWMESGKHRLPPEFTAFLDRVRSGGNYLNLILTNLLDVSAAESGHLPVRTEEFYLRDWTDDLQNILEPVATSHEVRLVWQLPDDEEIRLRTDQLRLTQILLNLAHNAIKFSGGEGRRVTVGFTHGADALEISVSDEGPGIPADRLLGIFGEFSQNEASAPARDRGVGLGLAVVKQNADLLGATIHAENLPVRGMRFTVSLPAAVCC
jgi:PAS domain S-box-containing protein